MSGERVFDIVLMGATGFTGELVAGYLVREYLGGGRLRLALAGRNLGKLERVRTSLAKMAPKAAELELIVADSQDASALRSMAARTHVVCTTVGPYAKYGAPLVAACVEEGTHYCDLTGEPQFIRRMIDAHHERAREKGARIVHCCGFDSIPSDLGTFMVQQHAIEHHGGPCEEVKFAVTKVKGGFSGGTLASMTNLLDEAAKDKAVRRAVGHPYGLNPEGEQRGPDGSDLRSVKYDGDLQSWVAPFVMAGINTKVVRRANALRDYVYGRDFRYSEVTAMGSGPKGAARAAALTAGLGAFMAVAVPKPTRRLLERSILPAPGEGPSQAQRESGMFAVRLVGLRPGGKTGVRLEGRVVGRQDPGYGETSKMLAESALCLAWERDTLGTEGGVLTPSVAMVPQLLARLRAAGMTFDVREG